jgi:hypothetical protein
MRKPKLETAVRTDFDLYSLEQLRELHRFVGEPMPAGHVSVELFHSETNPEQIAAEIRWRAHREERRFWSLAVMTFVAAVAGAIAAVLAFLSWRFPIK